MKMKTIGKTVAALALLALPFGAKAQDSTAIKFFGAPKAIVRVYENAPRHAFGLGVDAGVSWNGISAGISGTVAQTSQKVVVEESMFWVSTTVAGVGVTGYLYTDLFYKVPFSEPVYGVNATLGKVKVGAETSMGRQNRFSDAYVKFNLGDAVPGLIALEWDGKVQAMGAFISTSSNVGAVSVSTLAQYNHVFESGNGSLQFRVQISPN